jgi:hypothetical protein
VVADFTARIKREITREDGTRLYHVTGQTDRGRAFGFDIEAADFESDRALKAEIGAAAGAQSAVRAGMTRHVGAAIKRLSDDVEQTRRYARTGWTPDGFVIPGDTADGVECQVPDALPYRVPGEANRQALQAGTDALDRLVRSLGPSRTLPVITYALTGPAVRHIGPAKRYGLFIKGRTGSLKTSFSQALMCLYGPGFIEDGNLLKMGEGMTRNAAVALAASAHDLPILFDNYKPSTGRGDKDFINLIHNVVEGGEKARLNRRAELKSPRELRAWPLVTGEDLPNSDPASLARLLAVEFSWADGSDNPDLTAAQERPEALSAVGRSWLQWLQSDDGQEAASELEATFTERRSNWAAYLRRNRPDMVNILRVASNLATSSLVFEVACRHPAIGEVLSGYRESYQKGLLQVADQMGDYTCESLEARRLLAGLKSLKAAGRVAFTRRLGDDDYGDKNRIGWWDEEGYYLLTDLAMEAVQELYKRGNGLGGVTKQTLYSQLQEIGLVAKTGGSRTTRIVTTPGKRRRVLHLKREALEESEAGASEDGSGGETGAGETGAGEAPDDGGDDGRQSGDPTAGSDLPF